MIKNIYLVASISMFLIITGCTFENEEDYFESSECDTLNLTYEDIQPIFLNNCASCHNAAFTQREGIELDSYESVVNSVNTGLVVPAINHEGEFNMPYNQPKLPDCTIQRIEAWIENNMPEN